SAPFSPSFTIVVPAATRRSSDLSATFRRSLREPGREERDLVKVINEWVMASHREKTYPSRSASSMFVSGARSCACDDVRVGGGEVNRFVGVDPSHPVADTSGALDDVENLTLTWKWPGLAGVNDDRV